MSFKLPICVVESYKDNLEKKSSFKKSLTREISRMCSVLKSITDQDAHDAIVRRVEELEGEENLKKRYVVTDVELSSRKILKEYRVKHDVTQSALLWLWIVGDSSFRDSDYNLIVSMDGIQDEDSDETNPDDNVEGTEDNKDDKNDKDGRDGKDDKSDKDDKDVKAEKQVTLENKKQHSSGSTVKAKPKQKSVNKSVSRPGHPDMEEIKKHIELDEYDGPTEDITLELPSLTVNNFKSSLPKGESFEEALSLEIRRISSIVKASKSKLSIVNHVKRIEGSRIEKVNVKILIDPDSMKILKTFASGYGVSISSVVWLWLSIDDNYKYYVFSL